jgi:hypothetical protein
MIKENTDIRAKAAQYSVGTETVGALQRYVIHHIEPGGFLYHVLCGDLFGAVSRADSQNRSRLADIAHFIHNELPPRSYGSTGAVNQWLAHRGEGS